jgi:uncharacterized protein YdgA (DUF945 family)
MKKIVTVVVVLAALLLVAPWGVGKLAEKRLDYGLEQLVKAAPYLKVVERKYTGGWFKSEQVVTFEVFGDWMKALSPKAIEDAMSKSGTAPDIETDVVLQGDETPEEAAAAMAAADAAAQAGAEAAAADSAASAEEPAVAEEAPKLNEMLRFTVHNEVLHGPVLGFSGVGIARVNSHFEMSEKFRKEIDEVFGPEKLLEVSTRFGFFGGGTTTFKSEGRTFKPKDSKTEITWETFKLAIGYSKDADKLDIDGKLPKFVVVDRTEQTTFTLTNMTMDGDAKRVIGDLYDGNFKFGIDKMSVSGKASGSFDLHDLELAEVVETKGDFTDVSVRMGTGELKAKELADIGVTLKEVHYDIGIRHLHAATIAKMTADMKAMYTKPLTDITNIDQVIFANFKETGSELLKHDPEFSIDRIGIVTPEGDGFIKGLVKLKGATADDFAPGSMSLIGKIDADITIDLSEKMIQKFPNGSTGAGAMVDAGYAKRTGDRLICKIIFSKGQLTVNGKPQAIPGLGGPPSGEGEMSPPPQE